jgi:hypothetical protein
MLFWGRIIGVCGVSVSGCLIYGLIERNLRNKIPLSKERSASLLPKNIESYISKNLAWTSYAAIAILALAYIISFFARKISVATFAGDLVFQILVDGICLATIWYVIRERVPHKKALSPAVSEDIGKLYKARILWSNVTQFMPHIRYGTLRAAFSIKKQVVDISTKMWYI